MLRFKRTAPAALMLLAACNFAPGQNQAEGGAQQATTSGSPQAEQTSANARYSDGMGSDVASAAPEDKPRPQMQLQIALDRLGFSPGVIDGKKGMSTDQALRVFQEARGLPTTGKLDEQTRQALGDALNVPATRVVSLPADYVNTTYMPLPDGPEAQAKLDRLGYTSLWERVAERFHTTPEVIKELNPQLAGTISEAGKHDATSMRQGMTASEQDGTAKARRSQITPGTKLRVPNVGGDQIDPGKIQDQSWGQTLVQLGVGTNQPKVSKVVVSKSTNELKAYDDSGKLVFASMVTSGSSHDPLPLGDWKVTGIAKNPPFHYNPELFWDASNNDSKEVLPPGPNGPVGVVWIDLSKEHYGIHGTSAPETIGRAQSHGCVRLTNWDAARLAEMVKPGVEVLFQA